MERGAQALPDNCFVGGGEMGAAMRAFDWAKSPLGPVAGWPQSLRTSVGTCLSSRFPILVWWGPSFVKLYNDAYRVILGAKHPFALGRRGREVWPEIWDVIGPMLDAVWTRGEATWSENILLFLERRGFAEETYFTFSYSPIRDESGRVAGIFSAISETTGQVLSERRLRALRDLGERVTGSGTRDALLVGVRDTLAANAADVPFSLLCLFGDDDGNRQALTATGLEEPLPPIADGRALLAPEPEVVDVAALERILGGRLRMTGAIQATRAVTLPIRRGVDADASGALVVGLSPRLLYDERYRDFLDLVAKQIGAGLETIRTLEQSQKRAEALAEIDRAKTTFFSNVSHEFRTPLTLMLGPTEDALASGDGVMSRDSVAAVHRNGLRLLKLVNSLLDFARIEAGRMQASYQPTELATFTADLASAFRSAVERAGLAFDVRCDPLPEPIYVDRDMWEKIVLNLISNAFKFTLAGAISVELRGRGDHVQLIVTDTGGGIPEHELPRLFERFHRIDGTQSRTHEGSGIGLALVHELVRLHGGSITVASEVARGSRFTVTIPTGTRHLPALMLATGAPERATARGTASFVEEALRWTPHEGDGAATAPTPADGGAMPAGAETRILVADDNADMRDYLRRILSTRWTVETVADGAAALARVRARPPALVITDLMMPNVDGFALLRVLRRDEATRRIPVIFLSARAGEEARVEGVEAGADDYLVKPFVARELVARVEAQLAKARFRELEEERVRELANLFENAPVAIAIMRGEEHVFQFANAVYLGLVPHRDIIGKPIRAALPELAGQGVVELLDGVYRTGEPFITPSLAVVLNRGPGGAPERGFFNLVYQPLRDDAGAVGGIAVVATEVTELENARAAAVAANRAKDEFLAILGHELRNPLAPILTALQLMRLRGSDAAEREAKVIDRQVKHLARLVDDLLDVSRVTSGKIELKREPVELADIVTRAIEMSSPLFEQRSHRLMIDVPRRGLVVHADVTRLAQVLSNLLTNAAKYTEAGGEVVVSARADRATREAVIAVRDSGVGISPEILPRVFDLFTQERQALDRSQGGLGLGLAIVRSLVTLHGGVVSAHSDGRDRGSEFVVRLPLADGEARAPDSVAPPRPERRARLSRRVLVVDDNQDAASLLSETLRMLGYEVRVAHDGPSALDAAGAFTPEIGLLDIGLPVMDGYELARRLRQSPALGRMKLVAVTGYGQESDRRDARSAGFDEHLVKPLDIEALASLLAQMSDRASD